MSAIPLSVVAVVLANDREALVLNRALHFVYQPSGKDYIGNDGPFRDVLRYERGGGRFVAFAGREIAIDLADGTTIKLKDHWWQSHFPGTASVAVNDMDSLKNCYVFYGGACIAHPDLAALRATYDGPVYPYWDYEKMLRAERAALAATGDA